MLTTEIRALDATFQQLVKRRRGQMIRRGGAGSRDFEISLPFCGHEVLVGVESGWTADDALFLFVRHARAAREPNRAHPFVPPRPPGVEEVVGRKLLPEDQEAYFEALEAREKQKGPGGRAGGAGTATASTPAGSHDGADARPPPPAAPPPIPGFSVSARRLSLPERLFHKLLGRRIHTDKKRPGWFHVELDHDETVSGDLQSEFRIPLAELLAHRPLSHLSIGMTPHIFRIRRTPVYFELEEIDRFITSSLELFTSALAVPPAVPAIDDAGLFLLDVLYEVGRGARCGVCGEEATVRRVLCAKCMTPHHDECWKYSGGCSIFGCGGTRKAPA